LIGHSSDRGVLELLRTLFHYEGSSLGDITRIVQRATLKARELNQARDRAVLGAIGVGAHDEIYQGRDPVLVGVDVKSTYCYLLAEADACDETTWGVHLLDLSEMGLALEHSVADGGLALRAGQAAAWPGVPCHGDVFHAERDLGRVATFLEHRAAAIDKVRRQLESQLGRPGRSRRAGKVDHQLEIVRREHAQAIDLARDVSVLSRWLRQDVLALAGESLPVRRELFDFIVEELRRREPLCPHRIGPVRRGLERQREVLLAFAGVLDQELADIAERLGVGIPAVRAVCLLVAMDPKQAAYWQRRAELCRQLGGLLYRIESAVGQALAATTRASSMVENLNSRLRSYFFLRRLIGQGYLDLLRFFLNHRRYQRSARPERVGHSPAELLAGQELPPWLEQLGYPSASAA